MPRLSIKRKALPERGAYGRGRREPELVAELQRLRDEAERVGLKMAWPALEEALKAA